MVIVGAMGLQHHTRMETGIHLCKYYSHLPGLPPDSRWVAPSANTAYARQVIESIGPFEENIFAGDAVQSWKASQKGYEIWFEPLAVVNHIHELSLSAFLGQRIRRGREFAR